MWSQVPGSNVKAVLMTNNEVTIHLFAKSPGNLWNCLVIGLSGKLPVFELQLLILLRPEKLTV